MIIGVPREIQLQEGRVGLTPSAVAEIVRAGHRVVVQQGAGMECGLLDDEYVRAGAEVAPTIEEVYDRGEMIWKVEPPTGPEPALLRPGRLLLCFLNPEVHPTTPGVLAVAFERIRLPGGGRPILRPMSEVAGRMAIQVGARCLERSAGGRGVLLGGVPGVAPAHVVILGSGVVGWNAMRGAVGLGADVLVLDTDPDRLRPVDDAFAGRVKTLHASVTNIEESLTWADLVIGAVRKGDAPTPVLASRDHLGLMQPGAAIVDVSVTGGGCFETTRATSHAAPTYTVDGVIHYAVSNMAGTVPRTSTPALVHAALPYGLAIASLGLEEAARRDPAIASAIVSPGSASVQSP
jgi:alanine dehydrogenase